MRVPYISSIELSKQLNIPASSIRNFRKRNGIKTKEKLSYVSKEAFISKYLELQSQEKMANFYGVDRHTICCFSNKIGFDDSVYKKNTINEEVKRIVLDSYGKRTSSSLSKELKVPESTITGLWSRNNLKGKIRRRYILDNENYFEDINSQDKAYYLGFIGADGCLYETREAQRQNILTITIQKRDIKILHLLKEYLKTDKPISIYTNSKNTYASLEISSNKIFNDIKGYGLLSQKTYKNTIANIPSTFMPALIRGYFDGDGTISNHKDIGKTSVSIVGYESNLQKIKTFLEEKNIYGTITECNNKKYSKTAEDGSRFCVYTLCNKTSRYCFLKLIYENSDNVFLDRKYNRSKQYIDLIEQSKNIRDKQIVIYYKYAVQKVC